MNTGIKGILIATLTLCSATAFAGCVGSTGPGGACSTGPGGGLSTGPGGGLSTGPGGDVPQDPVADCRLGPVEGFQLDLAVDFLLGRAEVAQPDRAGVYPLDPEVGYQRGPMVVVQLVQVKTLTPGTALTQIAERQVILSWSKTRAMATLSPLPPIIPPGQSVIVERLGRPTPKSLKLPANCTTTILVSHTGAHRLAEATLWPMAYLPP
jgi:hypothetical protein